MSGRKKRTDKDGRGFTGGFFMIPNAVFDSTAFKGCTDRARSLLMALARQIDYNKPNRNNGRLQLTRQWLAEMGYPSKDLNDKARDELLERGLIAITKKGGRNMGCDWFALTWLPINDFSGLDASAASYHQGAWADCKLPPTLRRQPPKRGESLARSPGQQKQKLSPDYRPSAGPTTGQAITPPGPTTGPKNPVCDQFPAPTTGHNESLPSPIRLVRGFK